MLTNADLKGLLEAEISLRLNTDGTREEMQAWVDSVSALRKAVPDWSKTMLGLINDLECAGQPAGKKH
ncbi:hypothetical protein H7A76_32070 [Pseudomonas sp. MSSRFD41]|uniref:hypothetical protein n=1 Tax=Pseudomonas sp. MSSRFD41 TaxID=1310370 RepID=UPI00163AE368|nr:hypothetical protein [Pseudomonas sp. MSSRFD41]MBC2660089.1 hypothetical protein [Pseudomonas sp. MSSRFD41]